MDVGEDAVGSLSEFLAVVERIAIGWSQEYPQRVGTWWRGQAKTDTDGTDLGLLPGLCRPVAAVAYATCPPMQPLGLELEKALFGQFRMQARAMVEQKPESDLRLVLPDAAPRHAHAPPGLD